MTLPQSFMERWGLMPLCVYVVGVLLPALLASERPTLLATIGLPAFAVVFWSGPFASAAALFWTGWSATMRLAWILLIPVLAAPTFLPLVS